MLNFIVAHGCKRYKVGFGDGLFYGALLVFTISAATLTLSHWWYSSEVEIKREETVKVKELLLVLEKLEPDEAKRLEMPVVMSTDPEGNDYSELSTVEKMGWDAEECNVGVQELTPELIAHGYGEEDVVGVDTPAFVLWP